MKLRILLASASTLVLALAVWFAADWEVQKDQNAYIPRSDFQKSEGIHGAFEYYRDVKSNIYTGKIEREDVLKMRKAVRKQGEKNLAKNDDVIWNSMGPDNVGGRTRAILPYPEEANTLIAGAISGGLFKTTNSGQTWERLSGFNQNLIVGSIEMLGNGNIYVGTGHYREGNPFGNGGSEFIGGGLFKSTDDGVTWSLVEDFEPEPFSPSSDWSAVNKLEADPNNDDRLWIGSDFGLLPYSESGGLEATPPAINIVDGDTSTTVIPGQSVQDIEISEDGENIIATVGIRTYVSRNGGEFFQQVNTGGSGAFPTGGIIDLGIAPDD
jgi:hypothetical protein